jgi:hypothetical protein
MQWCPLFVQRLATLPLSAAALWQIRASGTVLPVMDFLVHRPAANQYLEMLRVLLLGVLPRTRSKQCEPLCSDLLKTVDTNVSMFLAQPPVVH